MTVHGIRPNEDVPAGFEKLASLRDRLGSERRLRSLQQGNIEAFEYKTEDGSTPAVQIFNWLSEFKDRMLECGRKWHYFSPEQPEDPANSREVFSYGSAGRLLLVKSGCVATDDLAANRGGRPQKNWDRMWRKAVSFANSPDGLPEDRATLVRTLQDWMAETGQEVASDTTLKTKLRAVFDRKDETWFSSVFIT